MRQVKTIEGLRLVALLPEIDGLRHRPLHAERQLVRGHSRRQRRIPRRSSGTKAVELLEQADPDRRCPGRDGPFGLPEIERILGVDAEGHRVVGGPEVVAVLLVPVLAGTERDELGKFVVERPQPVVDPRPQGREVAVVLVPPRVKLGLRAVVAVGRPHRAARPPAGRRGERCAETSRSPRSRSDRAFGSRPGAGRA